MATSAASERVFGMAGHVVNGRRAKLKCSSMNGILFINSAINAKKRSRLTKGFCIFTSQWASLALK